MLLGFQRRLRSAYEPLEWNPATETSPSGSRTAPEPRGDRTASPQAPLAPRSALPSAPVQVSAYEEWQTRARANKVQPGAYSLSRVGKNVALALGQTAKVAAGAVGAAGATALLASTMKSRTDDTSSGGLDFSQIMALSAGPMLAGAATNLVGDLIYAVGNGRMTKVEAHRATYRKYVADSAEELAKRPDHVREPIRKIDRQLDDIFRWFDLGDSVDPMQIERLLKWRQQFLMAITSRPKVVTEWTTRAGRETLNAKIREAVKTYPEEVRRNLENILQRIAANSVVENDDKRRLQFRFKGPGGTGKDTFIRLIKEVLDLPVVEVVVPPERHGGVESLLGKDWDVLDQESSLSDEELFGPLGLALLKSGYSNTVVYLNEIKLDEQEVINGLKRLLDPGRKSIEFKSLSTALDWSHQTVFVASNDDINPDHALESRWETIELPYATRETKEDVARQLHKLESKNYRRPLADGHPVLDIAQQNELDRIFEAMLPMFFEEHDKKFPGARMDFARSVTTFIAQGLCRQDEDVEDQTREFITDYFSRVQSEQKPFDFLAMVEKKSVEKELTESECQPVAAPGSPSFTPSPAVDLLETPYSFEVTGSHESSGNDHTTMIRTRPSS